MREFQRLLRFPRKIVLYLSTNFGLFGSWVIISKLIRFDLGFFQASRPFYRKVKYRKKVLEEFQRLPRFPRKMVLYSSTNFRILKTLAIIPIPIRFDLGFWQSSKPFYRKLKDREKVLEEFQHLSPFPKKMVLYSSSTFRIKKSRAIISSPIRFDLGFWQISKWYYIKLEDRENVFEEFEDLARFRRKMILYWSTNFGIWKPWAIISRVIRFHLGFWQAWKAFHRKLKYREEVLEEFQHLPRLPRKMFLYSSTNFHILKGHYFQLYKIRFRLLTGFKSIL